MKAPCFNVLFVCSMNQWRSPTAEAIFRKHPLMHVRSAGTRKAARRTVNSKDLQWADVVVVMEQKHKQRLMATFPNQLRFKHIYVLDIPDEYRYMDDELVVCLEESIVPILEMHCA